MAKEKILSKKEFLSKDLIHYELWLAITPIVRRNLINNDCHLAFCKVLEIDKTELVLKVLALTGEYELVTITYQCDKSENWENDFIPNAVRLKELSFLYDLKQNWIRGELLTNEQANVKAIHYFLDAPTFDSPKTEKR